MSMTRIDFSGLDDATLVERIVAAEPGTIFDGVTQEQIERVATENEIYGGWLRIGGRKISQDWNNGEPSYSVPQAKNKKWNTTPLGPCDVLTSPEEEFKGM
jgi:hypothetical protein